MIENFDNLITLTFVKENLYDVGEKKDFTIIDSITKATFKATIIAICDYEYADKESSIKTIWFDAFNIENFKEEDLYEEPHYIVKLHEDFTTHKKGEELIIPQFSYLLLGYQVQRWRFSSLQVYDLPTAKKTKAKLSRFSYP